MLRSSVPPSLETLRQEITGGLSPLVNGGPGAIPSIPTWSCPSLAAYREFVAGLKARKLDDWGEEPSTTVVRQGWTRPLWHR